MMHARPAIFAALAVAMSIAMVGAPARAAEPPARELTREVYAFFGPGARDYMLTTADFSVLSTVAFFALSAEADGSLKRTDGAGNPTAERRAWESEWLGTVIDRAHAAGAKVVLTVSRFGWSAAGRNVTAALLSHADARARLVEEAADEVIARGVDGVNLDLEPMVGGLEHEFVLLIRALRAELDSRRPGLSLTFDSTGYGSNYPFREALAAGGADAVYIMAYPFKTKFSSRAGAVSPMAGMTFDVTEAVDKVIGQSSADKVILGLPNYAEQWPTTTRYLHSRTRSDWAIYGSPSAVPLSIAAARAAAKGRRWDAQQLVAWTRWRARACASCPLTWWQLYYDDTQSMGIKYDFVNERDLRGVGIWQLGYGPDRADFYSLMRDKFGSP